MNEAEVRSIADRAGLHVSDLLEHASVGVDNHIWFLGEDFVLRTPRDETAARYMRGELEIWEFVQRAGIAIPELIATGERGSGLPYMIVRRANGRLLGEYPAGCDLHEFIGEFVEQLVILHSLPVSGRPWHRPYDHFDPWPNLHRARDKELISPGAALEIEALLGRL